MHIASFPTRRSSDLAENSIMMLYSEIGLFPLGGEYSIWLIRIRVKTIVFDVESRKKLVLGKPCGFVFPDPWLESSATLVKLKHGPMILKLFLLKKPRFDDAK